MSFLQKITPFLYNEGKGRLHKVDPRWLFYLPRVEASSKVGLEYTRMQPRSACKRPNKQTGETSLYVDEKWNSALYSTDDESRDIWWCFKNSEVVWCNRTRNPAENTTMHRTAENLLWEHHTTSQTHFDLYSKWGRQRQSPPRIYF